MTQLLDDLKATRALISEPERWSKGASAKDVNGWPVATLSSTAKTFCLDGACHLSTVGQSGRLFASSTSSFFQRYMDIQQALQAQIPSLSAGYIDYWTWNDRPSTRHEDVLAVLDRAIAAEEART